MKICQCSSEVHTEFVIRTRNHTHYLLFELTNKDKKDNKDNKVYPCNKILMSKQNKHLKNSICIYSN